MNTVSLSKWRKFLPFLGFLVINVMLINIAIYLIFDFLNIAGMIWSVVFALMIFSAFAKSMGKEGHAFIALEELPDSLNWRDAHALAKYLGQHPGLSKWRVEVLEETVQLKRSKMFGLHWFRTEVKITEAGLDIRCKPDSPLLADDGYTTGLYTLDIRAAIVQRSALA